MPLSLRASCVGSPSGAGHGLDSKWLWENHSWKNRKTMKSQKKNKLNTWQTGVNDCSILIHGQQNMLANLPRPFHQLYIYSRVSIDGKGIRFFRFIQKFRLSIIIENEFFHGNRFFFNSAAYKLSRLEWISIRGYLQYFICSIWSST